MVAVARALVDEVFLKLVGGASLDGFIREGIPEAEPCLLEVGVLPGCNSGKHNMTHTRTYQTGTHTHKPR